MNNYILIRQSFYSTLNESIFSSNRNYSVDRLFNLFAKTVKLESVLSPSTLQRMKVSFRVLSTTAFLFALPSLVPFISSSLPFVFFALYSVRFTTKMLVSTIKAKESLNNWQVEEDKAAALEVIQKALNENAAELDLSYLNVSSVPSAILKLLPNLKELRLSRNNQEEFDPATMDPEQEAVLKAAGYIRKILSAKEQELIELAYDKYQNGELGIDEDSINLLLGCFGQSALILSEIENSTLNNILKELDKENRARTKGSETNSEKLDYWKKLGQYSFNSNPFEKLSSEQKRDLRAWLDRLEEIPNFSEREKEIACLVCQILELISLDEQFKEDVLAEIFDNLSNCENRIVVSFNRIYVMWIIHTCTEQKGTKEIIDTFISAAKTNTFYSVLHRMIRCKLQGANGEDTELYVYYLSLLKEEMKLFSFVEGELREGIASRNEINLEELKKDIEDEYLGALTFNKHFTNYLAKKRPQFKQEWQKVENKFGDFVYIIDTLLLENNPDQISEEEIRTLNKECGLSLELRKNNDESQEERALLHESCSYSLGIARKEALKHLVTKELSSYYDLQI